MSTNTFANGLLRVIPSLGNSDPSADNASTSISKINNNFERSVVLGGTWIGAGLTWVNNQLVLGNAPNQIVVGNSSYLLSNEFIASGGVLSLNSIPISKLTGALTPESIGMSNGSVLVGGYQGQGRAITLDLDTFSVGGDVLSLRSIPASAYTPNSIVASNLNLPPRCIPVGAATSGTGAVAVALGSMFSIVSGVLNVVTQTGVNYTNITATNNYVGANPKLLVASTDASNNQILSWQDSAAFINASIDLRLAAEQTARAYYVNTEVGNDSFTTSGNRLSPFKSVNRACLEVARRSYTPSGSNIFNNCVIYILSGTHIIDNRRGTATVNPTSTAADLNSLLLTNSLNYFNSVSGGVIIPRGCSIKGIDVRNTVVTPLFVPNPTAPGTGNTSLFKVTGGCFINQFAIVDNPQVLSSHHLLKAFTFANASDLTLYYQKVYAAFAALDNLSTPNLIPNILETQIVADSSASNVDFNGYPSISAISGASPYIFNVSLRSRFGMCGILADGNEVTGFKSMVAAQFTCVSNQVDPNAYVVDTTDPIEGKNYSPGYRHYGFKAINDAYAQLVSCFVIAAGTHYWVDQGGQLSITNSTSDFGGISLYAAGSSTTALIQDTGFAGVRLIPPTLITSDIRELIVGNLDPTSVTATSIGTTVLLGVAPVAFINSSYIYVRIADPTQQGQYVTLQSALVSTGLTVIPKNDLTGASFNVQSLNDTDHQNTIYAYINCLGAYRYQSTWFNSSTSLAGNINAALATEIARRKVYLTGANLFVARVSERRTSENRNYQLLITVPSSSRAPTVNYLLSHPLFAALGHSYYIAGATVVDPALLTGDTTCTSLPGTVYKVTILRANRPDTQTGAQALIGDQIQDLGLTPNYASLLSNLDARLYPSISSGLTVISGLTSVSVDTTSASYLTMQRLFKDLGYSAEAIATLLLPSLEGTLVNRYRCLPNLGSTVVNSAFNFNLTRPSLIRCSGHTWEWVGYRNYSTALPNLQLHSLSIGASLAALQTTVTGGQIYATGMDELGNLYQGRNVLSLATGNSQTVSFGGLQQQTEAVASSAGTTFTDVTVTGTLTAANIIVQNLTTGLLEFQPSSQLTVVTGGNIQPLTDATVPTGIIANPNTNTYGLVRAATAAEITAKSGNGYVRPSDVSALAAITDLSGLATLNNDQTITGVNTFTKPVQIANAVGGFDAVNLNQLNMNLSERSNWKEGVVRIGPIQIIFGRTIVYGEWQAPGSVYADISYASSAPGYTVFTSPPTVTASPDRLLIYGVSANVDRFNVQLDSPGGNIFQPNDCILCWTAIGYV